jgi:hypothetical protein
MVTFELIFPEHFENQEWEIEAKGWLEDVVIKLEGQCYRLSIFDPTRLQQEAQSEHARGNIFFEPNLIVVAAVSRAEIRRAVQLLIAQGRIKELISSN